MRLILVATATFGLEAVVKREIMSLGYEIIKVEDGKVTFSGDERAICRSNLWLRSADRVLLRMGEFRATDFEELFQTVKGMPWENLVPPDGAFPVDASCVKSQLSSVPACQKTVKKAIAERLLEAYGTEDLPESGAEYRVKCTLLKDRVTITVDTSGDGLHKRGYRVRNVAAPIKETLAAAMVELSFWKPGRLLVDPTCGSGTIAIEAAMIGRNIAPGITRKFASEGWEYIGKELWHEERTACYKEINYDDLDIYACDIDKKAVSAAYANAEKAGVEDCIIFEKADIKDLENTLKGEAAREDGIIMMNPPYGERIGEKKEIEAVYGSLSAFLKARPGWSLFLVTTDKNAEEKIMGRPADRRRKLYNGRLETCYYQFHGERINMQK